MLDGLFGFELGSVDIGLHEGGDAGEDGLEEGVESPFGDKVELVFFH